MPANMPACTLFTAGERVAFLPRAAPWDNRPPIDRHGVGHVQKGQDCAAHTVDQSPGQEECAATLSLHLLTVLFASHIPVPEFLMFSGCDVCISGRTGSPHCVLHELCDLPAHSDPWFFRA